MIKHLIIYMGALLLILNSSTMFSQKVNKFPKKTDPLYKKVEMYDKLMMGNHWNEGAFMQYVIFPPAGLDEPIIGPQADCLDPTSEMLAAYSYKYAISKDQKDREIANQIFEAILKLEKVTGVAGLVARSFNKTDEPLWHEEVYWYNEWHQSSSMPGYRWLGDLSADKFTSIFYGVGTFWELCADNNYKQQAADLLDRFIGRVVDNNFKLTDLDGKMTLWGNFCPDLPHQELNSLEMLAALKVTHHITGKERYNAAYHMLIDRYQYDDKAINAKILFPPEWRNVGDDYHAARSLFMLMRYEKDRSLLIKYKMSLNRHWYDWKDIEYTWEGNIWFVMVYKVLTDDNALTEKQANGIKDMWGIEREEKEFKIPQHDGTFKIVKSEYEQVATAMIRNYWFGRYYNLIDEKL